MENLPKDGSLLNDDMLALSYGPDTRVTTFTGCIVNGVKFLVKDRDARRKAQNSGVRVEGEHENQSKEFFGVLEEILELTYVGFKRVILFKCNWFHNGYFKGDKFFQVVDFKKQWYQNEPYVLAIQASQVFYVQDTESRGDLHVVQNVDHRHIWDAGMFNTNDLDPNNDSNENGNVYQQNECTNIVIDVDELDCSQLNRDDEHDEIVEIQATGHSEMRDLDVHDFIDDEELEPILELDSDNESGNSSSRSSSFEVD